MAIDWDKLGTGLLDTGLQAYKLFSATGAAKDLVGDAKAADAQRRSAYLTYANQMASLAPGLEAGYSLKPAQVQTAFAQSQINPATGKVGYTLDPRAQGMFDLAMQGARSSLDLAGGMDPKAHAAERFAAQQALLAPRRAQEENALMRKLQAQGLIGSATHGSEYADGQAVNPFMAALQGARAQADAEAAYRSLDEGEKYLDRLIGRGKGMLDFGSALDERGMRALNAAGDWTTRFTGNEQAKARATRDLMQQVFEAQRMAAYDDPAARRIMEAKAGAAKVAGAARDSAIDKASALLNQAGGIGGILKSLGINIGGGGGGGGKGGDGYMDLGSYEDMATVYDDYGGFEWDGDWSGDYGGYDWGGDWYGGFDDWDAGDWNLGDVWAW